MVGVKVGKENRFQLFQGQATNCRDLSRASASIDQIQGFSGENRDTRLSTARDREWGGSAAKKYLEALVLTQRRWTLHHCGHGFLQKPVLPCARVPGPDSNHNSENAKASQQLKGVLNYLDPLILRPRRTSILTPAQQGLVYRRQVATVCVHSNDGPFRFNYNRL
jgi:hypothetical protein